MRTRWLEAIIPIVVCVFGGCDEPGSSVCGDGREMNVQGLDLCVYEGSVVIETGFRCPADRPYEHEIDDAIVCADRRLDEQQVEDVRERLEEDDDTQYADVGFDGGSTTADAGATAWTDVEEQDAGLILDAEPTVDMQNACTAQTVGCRVAGTEREYDLVVEASPLMTLECLVEVGEGVVFDFWEVIERPDESVSEFEPSADVANPTFFLDLAGYWTLSPRFHWEAGGDVACASPLVEIASLPCCFDDIHLQLVWETEGDEDLTDDVGADVDLHLLREDGTWGEAPWDCFWNNREPDWGESGNSNNPSLDFDDIDGWGPENINLEPLEDDVGYHVGFYYKDDGGFGPSLATLRAFFEGAEVFAMTVELEATDQFCEIARFRYNEQQDRVDFSPYVRCTEGYPE